MDFQEANRSYVDLKQQYDNGRLSAEEFEARLAQSMVQDGEGRWWSKHPETGAWYCYDGTNWVEDIPPGYAMSEPLGKRLLAAALALSRRLLAVVLAPGKRLLAAVLALSRRLLVAALVAAALLGTGAIAIASGGGGGAPPTATIVSDFPLHGQTQEESESLNNAITLALEDQNNKAGDVQIKYVSQDDSTEQDGKWTEEQCKKNANSAAEDEQIVGWIGPYNSGCAKAEIPILNQAKLGPVAMVSPANTYVGLTKEGGESDEPDKYYTTGTRNYARVVATDDKQARAGAGWMKDTLGKKRVFILDDGSTYGKGLADQFQQSANQLGIYVLGHESINRKDASYRSLMDRIAQTKPDAIYCGLTTDSNAAQLVNDKVDAGMPNDKVIVMGADGILDQAFVDAAGDAAEGVYATFPGLPPQLLPERGQDFVKRYEERFPGSHVENKTAYAYEAANALLAAIKRAYENDGKVTREGVVRELFETKDYDGVLGTWSFDRKGDTDSNRLSGQQVRNGKFSIDTDKAIGVPM